MIHRDIKPSNVMMTEDRHCKIGDFGTAVTNETCHRGVLNGTRRYQAIESFRGVSNDARSDVYSLAVCVWEILSRRVPWGPGQRTVFDANVAPGAMPTAWGQTANALQLCFAYPEDRLSADELATAIEDALSEGETGGAGSGIM